MALPQKSGFTVGHSQYHLAVAGGYEVDALDLLSLLRMHPPVVLTMSKSVSDF